jgi:capsular polysaccharide export protein
MDKINSKAIILSQGNRKQFKKMRNFSRVFIESKFIKFPRFRWRDYPESHDRAVAALGNRSAPFQAHWLNYLNYFFLKLQYNWCRYYFESNDVCGVVWNGLKGERYVFSSACHDAGGVIYYLEGSPIPGKITVDLSGVNFLNSLPRDIEFYKKWAFHNKNPPILWQSVASRLVARKSNVKNGISQNSNQDIIAKAGNFIFCPLQVANDSQIKLFAGYAEGINELIEKISHFSSLLPEGWHLRVKEHPSSTLSYKDLLESLCSEKLIIDNSTDTFLQVKASKAVLTINSSVGLQALFLERPIAVLGDAFFGIPGVAHVIKNDKQLAELFSNPDKLKWDAFCVLPYLNYLINEYYTYDEGN